VQRRPPDRGTKRTQAAPPSREHSRPPLRKLFLATCFLLSMSARPASGEGVNLAWNDCAGSSASTSDQTFACDDDSHRFSLVGSFTPPAGIAHLTAVEGCLDVISAGPDLPDWWKLDTGVGCRSGSLYSQIDFGSMLGCTDYWGGQAAVGCQFYTGIGGPGHGQICFVTAIAQSLAGAVTPGREYYAFKLVLRTQGTTGHACGGCSTGLCIVVNSFRLDQRAGDGDYQITRAGVRNYVTWQGGGPSCPGANAPSVRKNSWGQVKNMYR